MGDEFLEMRIGGDRVSPFKNSERVKIPLGLAMPAQSLSAADQALMDKLLRNARETKARADKQRSFDQQVVSWLNKLTPTTYELVRQKIRDLVYPGLKTKAECER